MGACTLDFLGMQKDFTDEFIDFPSGAQVSSSNYIIAGGASDSAESAELIIAALFVHVHIAI